MPQQLFAPLVAVGRGSVRSGLVLMLTTLAACAGGGGAGAVVTESAAVPEEVLRRPLSVLASDSLMGRRTGEPGARMAAYFLAEELRLSGVAPAFPSAGDGAAGYLQAVPLAVDPDGRLRLVAESGSLPSSAGSVEGFNVVGVVHGSDPTLRGEAVVLGAHYDHVGVGEAVDGDSIYNGADDDASGVVTVLEVARALAEGPPPARSVVILLTTAEEQGMLGTLHYAREPVVPLERTAADLQVEMVGRPDGEVGGAGRAWLTGFERSTIGAGLGAAGLPIVADPRPAQRFFERSDNIVFACHGIPAHTLSSFGLHEDYHRPSDEVDRIDFAHLAQIAEATTRAVRLIANGEAPEWVGEGDPSGDPAVCG